MKKDVKLIGGAAAGLVGAMVYRLLRGGALTLGDVLLGAVGGVAGMMAPEVLDLGPGYHVGAALVPIVSPLGRIVERTGCLDWAALLATSYHAVHYGRLALVAINTLSRGT